MSSSKNDIDTLLALETVERIFIRPYARMNEFVGYLVFTVNSTQEGKPEIVSPIIYNIEVNEKTNQLRIRDGTREVKFTCTGSLFEPKTNLLVWSQENNFIGTVYENYVQEEISDSPRMLVYQPSLGATLRADNASTVILHKQQHVGNIYGSKKACSMSICYKGLTVIEKLMLLITGLKFLCCKHRFHQHPLPTNLLHTREALIPPTRPTLEAFSRGIMRIAFNGVGNHFFAEILDAATHNIQLVIHYTTNVAGGSCRYFMDVFGNVLFTSNTYRGNSQCEYVTSRDGSGMGVITQGRHLDFIDSNTGQIIMGKRIADGRSSAYPDCAQKITQIFVAGRPNYIICDIYEHVTQGNIRINFIQAVNIEKKALIFAHLSFLASRYFKDLSQIFKASIQEYPLKKEKNF